MLCVVCCVCVCVSVCVSVCVCVRRKATNFDRPRHCILVRFRRVGATNSVLPVTLVFSLESLQAVGNAESQVSPTSGGLLFRGNTEACNKNPSPEAIVFT